MTVEFRKVDGFNQMTTEQAHHVVHQELIPACAQKGVQLSGHGSLPSPLIQPLALDIKKVQRAYALLDRIVKPCTQYQLQSSSLTHRVNKEIEDTQVMEDELIAAMLLKGYPAIFGSFVLFKATAIAW